MAISAENEKDLPCVAAAYDREDATSHSPPAREENRMSPEAQHGFGLFGPSFGTPEGGFCVSAFLLVEDGGKILAGRMDPGHADRWTREWAPNLPYYEGERREALFSGWRLPATYLRTGEPFEAAARRVATDQLALAQTPPDEPSRTVSTSTESRRSSGTEHWDIFTVHRMQANAPSPMPDHWADLAFRDPSSLEAEGMVMRHDHVLQEMG